jgi:hypothetical protein
VNVDPGYLDGTKLVLATTKNAGHRVYIDSGVHAEIELIYRCGAFTPLEWTYADYREPAALEFFAKVRRNYLAELKELRERGEPRKPRAPLEPRKPRKPRELREPR